jgi:hypothetical protein
MESAECWITLGIRWDIETGDADYLALLEAIPTETWQEPSRNLYKGLSVINTLSKRNSSNVHHEK